MRIGAFNLIKSSSQLSASSTNALYPVSNLLEMNTFKEYRSADGISDASITISLGQISRVDSVFLCGNKVTGDLNVTQITVKANGTDADWETPEYSKQVDVSVAQHVHNFVYIPLSDLDTDEAYPFWRIELSNPGGSFVGISSIFLGESKLLNTLQADLGLVKSRESNSKVSRGRYGQPYIDEVNTLKTFSLTFSVLSSEEYQELKTVVDYVDIVRPLWVVIDDASNDLATDLEDFAGYFLLDELPEDETPFHGLQNTSLVLKEIV